MPGLFALAYKLLVNDRAKFTALLIGITFAVFLILQMTSMFAGVLKRASATVVNVGAKVWVMDPSVNNVVSSIGMPDYVEDFARSIPGVAYAVPLYSGAALARLPDGSYQPVSVLGLDDTSLFGRPELVQGRIEDIYADNGFVIVDDSEYPKLGSPPVGASFELNDRAARIVGVARVASSTLFGIPTLYTTYSRAVQYIPSTRFTTAYVLIEPKSPADVPVIQRQIGRLGYLALTSDQFIKRIANFYTYKTGLGTNILLMTVISFMVGLSISGQTFYSFIIENLEKFGALKAIGAKGRELVLMILFQATFVSLTGFGLGIGLSTALIALAKMRLASYAAVITFDNLALAFVMVIIIAGVSSYVGVRRVLRIEPFDIFRG